jgi:hypothetical protein
MIKVKIKQKLSDKEIMDYCNKNDYILIFAEHKNNETILNVMAKI